jgi:hypothetical protein
MYRAAFFFTSALVAGEWSASRPQPLYPGERAPGTNCIGGLVDPIASLDHVEKRKALSLQGFELRPLGRPARGQSLYRLSYPGFSLRTVVRRIHIQWGAICDLS